MNTSLGFDSFLTFINTQLKPADQPWAAPTPGEEDTRRAVALSRQSGSGGHLVAEKLRELLQAHTLSDSPPWTIFDRNLVEKAIEEHHLPKRLLKFMPEDRISGISDTMDELFGLHPPSWMLVRQLSDTILRLAEVGNVIVIGRAAHVITAKLNYVVRVRLVGSLGHRVAHMRELKGLGTKEAMRLVRQEDLGRERYLRKYFNKDIDDPLLYDLIINTDSVPYDKAASIIAEMVLHQTHPSAPAAAH